MTAAGRYGYSSMEQRNRKMGVRSERGGLTEGGTTQFREFPLANHRLAPDFTVNQLYQLIPEPQTKKDET